jgi:hypothetical protein
MNIRTALIVLVVSYLFCAGCQSHEELTADEYAARKVLAGDADIPEEGSDGSPVGNAVQDSFWLWISCSDSDGIDYLQKGEMKAERKIFGNYVRTVTRKDSCIDGSFLGEWYCSSEGNPAYQIASCESEFGEESFCDDGRCSTPADLPECGDDACEEGETAHSCPADCNVCLIELLNADVLHQGDILQGKVYVNNPTGSDALIGVHLSVTCDGEESLTGGMDSEIGPGITEAGIEYIFDDKPVISGSGGCSISYELSYQDDVLCRDSLDFKPDGLPNLAISANFNDDGRDLPAIYGLGLHFMDPSYFDMIGRISSVKSWSPFTLSDSYGHFRDQLSMLENSSDMKYLKALPDEVPKYIPIVFMPKWLSANYSDPPGFEPLPDSTPSWFRSPPRCYGYSCGSRYDNQPGYSQVVYDIVDFYSNRMGLENVYYLVQNEVESYHYWLGSDDDYFLLYKTTVDAGRDADPDAKFGPVFTGIGLHHWCNDVPTAEQCEGFDSEGPMMLDFITFCKYYSLPIDVVETHLYPNELSVDGSYAQYSLMHDALGSFGYTEAAHFLGETNYGGYPWSLFGNLTERDDSFNAAFLLRSLQDMDASGVDSYAFFHTLDAPFGNFGLLYRTPFSRGIEKPVFRLFRLIDRLKGTLLSSQMADSRSTALITKDEDGSIAVLISHLSGASRHATISISGVPCQDYHYTHDVIDGTFGNWLPEKEEIILELDSLVQDSYDAALQNLTAKGYSHEEAENMIQMIIAYLNGTLNEDGFDASLLDDMREAYEAYHAYGESGVVSINERLSTFYDEGDASTERNRLEIPIIMSPYSVHLVELHCR